MTTPDLLINNYKRLIEVNETFLKTLENESKHNVERFENKHINFHNLCILQTENNKERMKAQRNIASYKNKISEIQKSIK